MPRILRAGAGLQIKPIGVQQIDWTHPLAFGLISYWFDPGVGRPVDLVSGHTAVLDTAGTNLTPKATAYGTALSCIGSSNSMHDPGLFPIQSWAHPYSCAVGLFQIGAGAGTNAGYFGIADASGNDPFLLFQPSTTTFGMSIGNGGSANNFTFANNTFYIVVAATTGASAWNWWINGLAQTNGSTTTTYSGANLGVTFGSPQYNSPLAENTNAAVFFGAIWKRTLSAGEAIQLWNDPYCFLVPQEPEMMIIRTAAVADVLGPQIWM